VLDAATGKRAAIQVFGDDYDTPDGTCIRDYIHVTDLAAAHVLALRALEGGSATTCYNLGNGQGYSVKEVIAVAEKVTGKPIPVVVGPRREGDPARLVGDATRAIKYLGWKPQFDRLEQIIDTAWRWHSRTY
jgi:UDP-glucose 4-epimerase